MSNLSDVYSQPQPNPWSEGHEYVRHDRQPNLPGERVTSLLSSEEIIQIMTDRADELFDSIRHTKTKEETHDAGIKYEEAVAILALLGIGYDSRTGKRRQV